MNKVWRHTGWNLSSLLISGLIFFPVISLGMLALEVDATIWAHLKSTVLSRYLLGSLELMLGVAVLSLLLGVGSAWLVTQYRFRGLRFFSWALLLPLAMPAYINAYSYTGLLDVAGPVQTLIRNTFEVSYGDYWFPEIRSMSGAIFVISFALYPYIYLLARASFLQQSSNLRDVSQLLGYSQRQAFFKITLPIARPAIIAGLSLALMETLADYGTVDYFGIDTFTTGIFRTWYGLDSINAAAQLALFLLMFIIVLVTLEKTSRRRAQFYNLKQDRRNTSKTKQGYHAGILIFLCSMPILFGFVIPGGQLIYWAIERSSQLQTSAFWSLVSNTLLLAGITTILALLLALLLAYGHRISNNRLTHSAKFITSLGYAIPGMVIAVGVLIPLAKLDKFIDVWASHFFNASTGLLISGTLGALLIAYLARFMAVSLNTVDAGLANIKPSFDQAGRSLGHSSFSILCKVHIPMLHSSLFTALLIVFVDVMKELPATLILRPFNFNTLAVRAYELASDEQLNDASLPALAIILAGLIPVILLSRAIDRSR